MECTKSYKKGEEPLQGSVTGFLEETEISLPSIPNLQDSWNSKGGTFYLYMLRGNKKMERPSIKSRTYRLGIF